ncbi:putative mannan synthase 11 [Iris pallida]|uniref:glucomannan 4-beta-mannosyltransferase n=1 Tax=Iris pallida TaxID=29817 RepID=A0AAX6GTV2_IRIPA|nr:putative mannan synthase 11 [Iris pallida]
MAAANGTIGGITTQLSPLFLELASFSTASVGWDEAAAAGAWLQVRASVLAPALRLAEMLCLAMSVMLVLEKLTMGAVSFLAKVFRWRPKRRYKWEPMGEEADEEVGRLLFPMVIVQVPMYNERQVYKLSIGAACRLAWPADRIIVQVLDDSTDPEIKHLVELECKTWAATGVNVKYEIRDNRSGYKAGALREGMKHYYVNQCDYVAIFDADFQPGPEFLMQTIPFLVHNPDIALVQARWKFVNANECLMTRIQEMSMDYHFKVEQESGSTMFSLFGFNGTAGVWRILALNQAGGWKDRTTVEDMDLAIRATLCNWKFVYVGDVMVKSELPSTFKAYRNQQYRWACGPANLFRKIVFEIMRTQKVSILKKVHLIYSFFVVKRIFSHIVTFMFYCVVIPASVFVPEIHLSKWGVIYIPTAITLLNCVGTPSSLHLSLFWIFFENVMAMLRMRAVLIGLLEVGEVNEWVVTDKLGGAAPKADTSIQSDTSNSGWKITKRIYVGEILMAVYLFVCACYDFKYGRDNYYFYIFPQSIAFLVMGLGYVGTHVPN